MIYTYDGTYEGSLSVIFETYRLGSPATNIVVEDEQQAHLFEHAVAVTTQPEHAARVRKGIAERCSEKALRMLYRCFLSEKPGIEMLIYQFVALSVERGENIEDNFLNDTVLQLHKINKQIGREVHRMHAFVRFQETPDQLFVALIEPDFNVLPLLGPHFEERYPAFRWLIYDTRRHFGLYHAGHATEFITFDHQQHGQLTKEMLTHAETDYQQLWKTYFKSVDIPERRNLKLHLQHVPRRYWKYLIEKQ